MKDLLSAFGYLGVRQAAAVLFGLVRSKAVAWYLGPSGMGVVAQGTSLMRLFQQISSMGIGSGFVKLISQYRAEADNKNVNIIISTVMGLFGLVGIIVVALSYQYSEGIAEYIFDDSEYRLFVIIIAAASWVFVQYNFFMQIFRAMFRWRQHTTVAVLGYAISIFTTVALIMWFGLLGAVLSILVAQVINLLISMIVLYRDVVVPEQLKFWNYRPTKEMISIVFRFIGPLTVLAILPIISLLYIRSEIIRQLGSDANGIFQVVWGISVTYMGFLALSLSSYGVPKVASLLDNSEEVNKVQNHAIRLGLFLVTPILILLAASRELWIPILYSSEFLAAGGILIWQLGADFFRILKQAMNITLIPRERFGYLFFDTIMIWLGWMTFAYYFLPIIGLAAAPLGYFVVNLIQASASFVYQKLKMGFHISNRNKSLALQSILIATIAIGLSQYAQGIFLRIVISGISLLLIAFWIPTKREQEDLLSFAKEVFSKRGKSSDLDLS